MGKIFSRLCRLMCGKAEPFRTSGGRAATRSGDFFDAYFVDQIAPTPLPEDVLDDPRMGNLHCCFCQSHWKQIYPKTESVVLSRLAASVTYRPTLITATKNHDT